MVLPVPLKNRVLRFRDQLRLQCVARLPCDPGWLRTGDPLWVRKMLEDPTLRKAWAAVEPQLRAFGIANAAGGVNPGDRRALYYLVHALRPNQILEIGTHIGASTVHIAAALRDAQSPGSLVTVDLLPVNDPATRPWAQPGSALSPEEMIARVGMTDAVRFVTQSSLRFLAETDRQFDLIFLDGGHAASTVYRELAAALHRLAPNAIVLLHDYFPGGRPLWPDKVVIPGPWLAISRLLREGAALQVVPVGALPWPTKQGTHMTSLALVVKAP